MVLGTHLPPYNPVETVSPPGGKNTLQTGFIIGLSDRGRNLLAAQPLETRARFEQAIYGLRSISRTKSHKVGRLACSCLSKKRGQRASQTMPQQAFSATKAKEIYKSYRSVIQP
jgi:hypothetical protein